MNGNDYQFARIVKKNFREKLKNLINEIKTLENLEKKFNESIKGIISSLGFKLEEPKEIIDQRNKVNLIEKEYLESLTTLFDSEIKLIKQKEKSDRNNIKLKQFLAITSLILIVPAILILPFIGFENFGNMLRGDKTNRGYKEFKRGLMSAHLINANFYRTGWSAFFKGASKVIGAAFMFATSPLATAIALPFMINNNKNYQSKSTKSPVDYRSYEIESKELAKFKNKQDEIIKEFINKSANIIDLNGNSEKFSSKSGRKASSRIKYLASNSSTENLTQYM